MLSGIDICRRSVWRFAFALLISGSQGFSQDELDNPVAADVRVCPDGHTTLKDVPVRYGLLRDTEAGRKAIENLEFTPGGCSYVPGFSKTSQVVCTTCRLWYWGNETWYGSSTSLKGFARPLTEFATRLAFAGQGEDPAAVRWAQMIRSNRVEKEYVYVQVQLPVETVCSTMTNCLAQFDIHAQFMQPKRNPWGPGKETDYYYLGAGCVRVELTHYLQETNVYIKVTHDLVLDGHVTNAPCARRSKK